MTPAERKQERLEMRSNIAKAEQRVNECPALDTVITTLNNNKKNEPISRDVQKAIIALIKQGYTLTKILNQKGAPSRYMLDAALTCSSDFTTELAYARELGAAAMVDEVIDIADEIATDNASIARNNLRIQTRLKVSGYYNSKFKDGLKAEDVSTIIAATITAARNRKKKAIVSPTPITVKPL